MIANGRSSSGSWQSRYHYMAKLLERAAKMPRPIAVPGFEHIRRHWDPHVQHWSAKILPGEFYVTRGDEAVSTVLGSCVAACVRDVESGVGGMNHFMLPEEQATGADTWSQRDGTPSTRYGVHAMESLINEILKLDARRDRLELKLFGGGSILPATTEVGRHNIEFARRYAQVEGMRIAAEDLGGIAPRHVIFFPATGRALLKRLKPLEVSCIVDGDERYRATLIEQPAGDDVELFS